MGLKQKAKIRSPLESWKICNQRERKRNREDTERICAVWVKKKPEIFIDRILHQTFHLLYADFGWAVYPKVRTMTIHLR